MYTDDTLVDSSINTIDDCIQLQRDFLELICSHHIKEYCFKTSMQPIIEYASTVRAPHTTQDTNKIEMLQRSGA